MPARAPMPRRTLVSIAGPHAVAPMSRALRAQFGYAILEPEAFAAQCEPDDRPDAFPVDERCLADGWGPGS